MAPGAEETVRRMFPLVRVTEVKRMSCCWFAKALREMSKAMSSHEGCQVFARIMAMVLGCAGVSR